MNKLAITILILMVVGVACISLISSKTSYKICEGNVTVDTLTYEQSLEPALQVGYCTEVYALDVSDQGDYKQVHFKAKMPFDREFGYGTYYPVNTFFNDALIMAIGIVSLGLAIILAFVMHSMDESYTIPSKRKAS